MQQALTTILFDVSGGVARITLNRPDKLNSFNETMHAELRQALDKVQANEAVRVLVLTGSGRGFCAGQDLGDRSVLMQAGQKPDLGQTVERHNNPLILKLQGLRVPTIAAVNGVAAGAGANLALACDLVVAGHSASFIQAFSKIGLIPDTGGTWLLPQRVGMARAMGLALLADKLPAAQAAEWGLIWQAVADADLGTTVDQLAQRLATAPTRALVATRQAMRASMTQPLAEHLHMEAGLMRELGRSADYAEGVDAFMNKRPAQFTGA